MSRILLPRKTIVVHIIQYVVIPSEWTHKSRTNAVGARCGIYVVKLSTTFPIESAGRYNNIVMIAVTRAFIDIFYAPGGEGLTMKCILIDTTRWAF